MKKSVRTLCECALLVALTVVLNRFVSFQALGLKFGLSFLPMALCGMLFSPVITAVCYALSDVIGFLLFPTGPFFPGFTVTCALLGLTYGLLFYKKSTLRFFPEITLSILICCGVLGLCLNTLWMSMLYTSKNFMGWFMWRLPQELGLAVLHAVLLPLVNTLRKRLRR